MSKLDDFLPKSKYAFYTIVIVLVLIYLVINPDAIHYVENLFEGLNNLVTDAT